MGTLETSLYTGVVVATCLLLIIATYFFSMLNKQNRKYFDGFARKNIEILEKERLRISADLHDELVPMVTISRMQIEEMLRSGSPRMDWLQKIEKDLQFVISGMRGIVLSLNTATLEKGLGTALFDHVTSCKIVYRIKFGFHYDVSKEPDHDLKVQVYRMVQELIQNVLKHAEATSVMLSIREADEKLLVEFTDNGKGFHPDDKKGEGIGLVTIRERVILLHGRYRLESKPGTGSHYYFEIPFS